MRPFARRTLLTAALAAVSAARIAAQVAAQAPPPVISAEALMATVRTLASESFAGRATGTAGGAKARAFIRQRFEALMLEPVGGSFEHPFSYTPKGRTREGGALPAVQAANVVARCPGTSPARPAIVLSAHYDHLGVRDGQLFPGADDNASGVAALLELAAACLARPFQRDVIIAAFDAEEGGLHGARAFVDAETVPRARLAVNVNLDMVARGDRGEIFIAGTRYTPRLRDVLTPVAARAPIRVRFGHDEPGTGDDDWTLQSDHGAFHEAGVPFVYFGVEDHPDYHRPTDTADRIDAAFFVHAVGVVLDALRALDAALP